MKPIKIKEGLYKITFKEDSEFWDVVADSLSAIQKTKNQIRFKADSIQTLKQLKLSYDLLFHFVIDIANQLKGLEKKGFSIPFFSITDFIIINGSKFVYINHKKVSRIRNNLITIDYPYKDDKFISPELENITTLPSQISYKSSYFSLASIAAFLLTNETITQEMIDKGMFWKTQSSLSDAKVGEELNDLGYEALLLETIYNTKLYWTLERCLYNDPQKRFYFYI